MTGSDVTTPDPDDSSTENTRYEQLKEILDTGRALLDESDMSYETLTDALMEELTNFKGRLKK